jgi:hypothetical protein
MIMSSSIGYLTSRSTFLQVSPEIPITKSRNPDKFDLPEVFEGEPVCLVFRIPSPVPRPLFPCSHPVLVPFVTLPWRHAAHSVRCDAVLSSQQTGARRRLDRQSETDRSSHPIPPRPGTRGNTGKSWKLFPPPPLITRYHAPHTLPFVSVQAHRLEALETAMTEANEEYLRAVDRASP